MARDSEPRRSGKNEPESVASALGRALGGFDLDKAQVLDELGQRWSEIVGSEVAAHARPVGRKGEVLHVEVDSSVWCQELQMRVPELLRALRDFAGDAAPTDLRFRVGYNRQP